ncbi:endonuclease/exonuclease/phosphatase family protein [Luteolibacter soli]|uniref:Endonuclease/exonuclease/phosphatase family protein n=1 Tax=Luteolibacter soli TaxID=3135280 RepID=A0ABU9B2R5_9BACT
MKLKSLLLLPLLGIASAADIRLVAWNLEWFPGHSPTAEASAVDAHKKAAAEVIQREKPDIFIGEEVRNWQVFADLAAVTPDLRAVVVSSFRSETDGTLWPQQVGIASKLPVEAAWSEAWQQTIGVPRGFSFAAVNLPAPETGVLLIYGVHLKSNRGSSDDHAAAANSRMREESAAQLLQHVSLMERLAFKGRIRGIVIAGDFNTNQDGQFGDKTLEILTKGGFHNTWEDVAKKDRLSWHGSSQFEPTTFDYILTKGLPPGSAKLIEVPEAASDHSPVTITLSFP